MIAPRLVMLSLLVSGGAFGQNFTIDIADTILPANHLIPVVVTGTDQTQKSFKISSSLFSNDQGALPISIEILKRCDRANEHQAAEGQSAQFDLVDGVASLCLRIPEAVRYGKYTGNLIVTGMKPDTAKKITFSNARDSVWLASLALVLGLVVSFVVTKILTGQRRRLGLLEQIHDLKVSKGGTLPPLPAVVWVDAVLSLSRRLSSQFWLTGADIIDTRVNGVRSTVGLLKQVRELVAGLQQSLDKLLFGRATEAIFRVVSELGAEVPDDTAATRIKTELTAFNDWLQSATFPAAFWNTIQPSLLALQRDIAAGVPPDARKAAIDPLKALLDAALTDPPLAPRDPVAIYRNYARLRILWDARTDNDLFPKLIANPPPDLAECFRLADDRDWNRLKAAHDSLTIQMPATSDPDGLEAFTPLPFSVAAPGAVGHSFLFRHKVEFAWQFTQAPDLKWHEKARGRKPQPVNLAPTTMGPSVIQYFPRRGQVEVSVKLSYEGDSFTLNPVPGPNIQDSSDFGLLDAFGRVEVVSWMVAAGAALATGLGTYYYKNPTFGSYQDYLALIMWGAGMDQGKNFLQALQAVSPQPAASPAVTR
jgi:hypothetical protein